MLESENTLEVKLELRHTSNFLPENKSGVAVGSEPLLGFVGCVESAGYLKGKW